jgi:hypothetical protein
VACVCEFSLKAFIFIGEIGILERVFFGNTMFEGITKRK